MTVHFILLPSRDGMDSPVCAAPVRKRGTEAVTRNESRVTCAQCVAWLKKQGAK